MREFNTYLNKSNGSNAVTNVYGPDELKSRLIFQDLVTRKHYVFDNIDEFIEYYQYSTKPFYFAELITTLRPQRLKLDIDSNRPIDIDEIINCALMEFRALWPSREDPEVIVCSAHGQNKYSYHLIFDAFVADNIQCQVFTARVKVQAGNFADVIDTKVNNTLQYFRIVGSHKDLGVDRPFIANKLPHLCLVSPPGDHVTLPSVARPPPIVEAQPPDDSLVEAVLAAYADPRHAFRCVSKQPGNNQCVLTFNRLLPDESKCDICHGGPHTNDSTMCLVVRGVSAGVGRVFRTCRRGGDPLLVAEIQHPSIMPTPNMQLERAMLAEPTINLFSSLPNKLVYDDPALRDFDYGLGDCNTLCVKANTKMGKTKKLKLLIDNYFSNPSAPSRIVFVSFRQTFSGNIKERFPQFSLYSEIKGDIYDRKVIIQVESLHRLATIEPADLLILDECESILAQFSSGLLEQFNLAWSKFIWLIRTAKYVVAMDAHLSDRTYRMFQHNRPNFIEKTLYHYATYKNAVDETCYLTNDRAAWFGALDKVITQSRVAIPISSLTEARALEALLRERLPQGKRIKIYSSETNKAELREHFSDVAKYWSQYDILIYTPTITAGVSFELDHFDYVFGYFVHTSCDASTCHQMMARIRNVRSKKSVVYLDPRRTYMPTDPIQIEKMLIERRLDLGRTFNDDFIQYNIADDGKLQIVKTNYWHLLIDNIAFTGKSRSNFAATWCSLAKESGIRLCRLVESTCIEACGNTLRDVLATGKQFIELHAVKKEIISLEHAEEVSTAADITEERAKEISQAIAVQEDVSRTDYLAFSKHKLQKTYDIREIDAQFVLKFEAPAIKRAYRNVRYFIRHYNLAGTVSGALRNMQTEELDVWYSYSEGEMNAEANAKYGFHTHRKIHGVLTAIGWQSLLDRNWLSTSVITRGLTPDVLDVLRALAAEFGIRPFTATDLGSQLAAKKLIACVNSILYDYYRHSVKSTGTVCRIEAPQIFTIQGVPPNVTIRPEK